MPPFAKRIGRFLAPAALAALAAACHVALVSPYDDTFDQELTSTQTDVASLFETMINNPDTANPAVTAETYAGDADAITKIDTDISGLEVRAKAHFYSPEDESNVAHLKHSFTEFVDLYKKSGGHTDIAFLQGVENNLNNELSLMMKQELLKKQGQASAGGRS